MKTKQKQKQAVEDRRERAKELITVINDSWYEFSKLAVQIDEERLWEQWGFATIKDYAEQELGIEYRTFRYRVIVGEAIERLGINKEDVNELGWSKFKELVPLLSSVDSFEEAKELFDNVSDLSSREAKDFVRTQRRTYAGEPAVTIVNYKFRLTNESASVVDEALERAKTLINTESLNSALEYICLDWIASATKKINPKILSTVKAWEEQRSGKQQIL